jgi:hypothetical protein
VALLVLGGVLALAAALSAPRPRAPAASAPPPKAARPEPDDRERALAALQRALAQGKPVTLVGRAGVPRWYRWRTERERTPLPTVPSALGLSTWSNCCLLELLPSPGIPSYVFSAEVLHSQALPGYVGIFCCADEAQAGGGVEQRFLAFRFADHGAFRGRRHVHFTRYREAGPQRLPAQHQALVKRDQSPPAAGKWHQLSVTVTPERTVASWDGKVMAEIDRAFWGRHLRQAWGNLDRPPAGATAPDFSPQGALGLYLDRSAAFFRNVVVRPLGKGQPPE